MARTRTTKKLAQRIDLNYFKRKTPLKRWKFWLSLALPLLALLWIGWKTFRHDPRVYSSGRLTSAHAVLEKECATCHLRRSGAYSAKAADAACLSCHDGPVHHANQLFAPSCSECHSEHRGRVNLAAAGNQACAQCHSSLKSASGAVHVVASIESFDHGHPQFAALREGFRDPGTIKLNHSLHMKPIRRGPNGPLVQLDCSDCHRPSAVHADWKYSGASYVAAKVSYSDDAHAPLSLLNSPKDNLPPPKPPTGRELMAPVRFATACASCHLLAFDKRFEEGVPHDKPEVIHAFVVKKFQEYIAAHPAELHEIRDPNRNLSGKRLPAQTQTLTPAQWVAQHTAVAEELLWHKTCAQCHTLTHSSLQDTSLGRWTPGSSSADGSAARLLSPIPVGLPQVAPANIIDRWMPHAKFDHDAHRGFACTSCHEKALTSTETTDVLLPGIATCRTCHAPGPQHAESRCFECHTYHDWSKRKEIKPTFILPELRSSR